MNGPIWKRTYMFMPKWRMPKWRKIEVRMRQYWWAPMVAGKKSPPQRKILSPVGEMKEMPLASMARKTRVFAAMRVVVMV
ncbi:MAG: hypothetical protein PW735_11445 [Acidobacteriaceae bacterium]|nr:hypothetical protein [Acidobacteriaceae bacterium]